MQRHKSSGEIKKGGSCLNDNHYKANCEKFFAAPHDLPGIAAAGVVQLLQCLEAIQLDPVATVERNHHLVAGLRLPAFTPADLENTLKNGQAFEYFAQAACILPMKDYPLFADLRGQMRAGSQDELKRYESAASYILSKLADEGPLPSNAFASETKVRGGWHTGRRRQRKPRMC